ncbi:MAG: NADH-quinone oxidoreductase subunit D [Anaerolineae bacterium CFX3]|jgi:NADH-quinone oxidoreductase subunit D|nr:NADH-quinone oxidoreductase subunit D [Anaerolineae bacterium CFX3]MCQ3946343.1 NADH-quinone oxidoreductase subunit D [Anaerolineae bacterium]MCZ7548545.1 NADH dehydrogenase (quinone) subunit D [Anaerolineales bacterium]OQY85998.1 MAG: NADH-quinone oxidoreductase subunit D [Anaerolineae bacterium UTCFX3]GER78084.1 NADH-quinone oxidoreductase subunit D [Candidatus Denitrolinea symbiosum]
MPQLEEVTLEELKNMVSDRALTGETMMLNLGPQHPATHGVLRLLLELDGEIVINVIPDIGFLHTGVEKNMEAKSYQKAEVMTDRLDYLNPVGNNLAFCMAVEKLVDLDVPPRALGLRVIMTELQRIASHLVWIGTYGLDLAAMSMFMYAFRERELILDMFELISGQRMMTTYFRPGGVWRDAPVEFEAAVRDFIKIFPKRVDEYEGLLTRNPFLLDRLYGIGKLTKEKALSLGATGPILRSTGVDWDLRKARPYMGYEQYDFNVPVLTEGDNYARYLVRVQEMRESLKIVEQALNKLPMGPVRSDNRKFVPPPRSEVGVSMEALIHHFKLWTDGFDAPKASIYSAVESPRGELGVFLEGDGGPNPYRIHMRTPSFENVALVSAISKGHLVADLIAIIGSLDFVLGDIDR